jgi:hypothetical protein
MKVSIHAPYAKERLETACQHSILHPEGIVGNAEVIPRNVGEQRASPPQSNSLAAAPALSLVFSPETNAAQRKISALPKPQMSATSSIDMEVVSSCRRTESEIVRCTCQDLKPAVLE